MVVWLVIYIQLLQAAGVEQDVSNACFPFMHYRALTVAGCPVRALRVTFVGELGYELHVPVEFARTLYEELWRAGQPLGVVNAGYKCIESLRLEKGVCAVVARSIIHPDQGTECGAVT